MYPYLFRNRGESGLSPLFRRKDVGFKKNLFKNYNYRKWDSWSVAAPWSPKLLLLYIGHWIWYNLRFRVPNPTSLIPVPNLTHKIPKALFRYECIHFNLHVLEWIGMKFNLVPLQCTQYMWIEMNTYASKQGLNLFTLTLGGLNMRGMEKFETRLEGAIWVKKIGCR